MNITATEFKLRLGRYLDVAETDPVVVEKSGHPKSVLISHAMYQHFLETEDHYWAIQAKKAEKGGYLGEQESRDLLFRSE
jgi:prevent-host-death family protein